MMVMRLLPCSSTDYSYIMQCEAVKVFIIKPSDNLTHYYLLYQLDTGGYTQKAQPIQGVYP